MYLILLNILKFAKEIKQKRLEKSAVFDSPEKLSQNDESKNVTKRKQIL